MYYLKTTWFGTFLYTDTSLSHHTLFPKQTKSLQRRIQQMRDQKILAEEKKICAGKKVIVQEKRLTPLGFYEPSNPVFQIISPQPQHYGFSLTLLHKIMAVETTQQTSSQLQTPDYHLIQMVNSLDELQHIANLLSERIDHWSRLPEYTRHSSPIVTSQHIITEQMTQLQQDIEKAMNRISPNITSVVGPMIGARLIAQAGSLEQLALFPASTIQILGAEKAFFRFKKEGGNPPKHGIIYQHALINRAPKHLRGKRARILASTLILAARADAFTKNEISSHLQSSLEKRIKEITNR